MNYGYVRVSTTDQNPDRQIRAMEAQCIPRANVYIDKISGKDFRRPSYQRLVRRLKPGDVLFVKSIDRLGRNFDGIQEEWRKITEKKRAAIVVMDMPLLDTRSDRDLMGRLIANIVLQLLCYVAQTEREFIHQRQAEGIAAAKARGQRLGRPRLQMEDRHREAVARYLSRELSSRQAAQICGVSHKTVLNWARQLQEGQE